MPQHADDADALVSSAVALLRENRVALAEAGCRHALAMSTDHVGALTVLSVLLIEERRFGEAVDVLSSLTRLAADEPAHWFNLGNARRGAGDLDGSLHAYAAAAERGEASSDFYYNLGLTHLERLDFVSARAVLERARALAPADAEVRYRLALACHEAQDNAAVAGALEGWQGLDGLSTELVARIAELLVNAGEPTRAAAALADALTDPAPGPPASLTLIQVLERLNRVVEAQQLLERLLANVGAAVLDTDLMLVRAQLARRVGDYDTAVRLYRQVLAAVTSFDERHPHLFLLGQSLDALGRRDEAFPAFTEAHASQAAYLARAVPGLALRGAPTMVITRYGSDPADVADWVDAAAPSVEQSPIFIVGFPRSGTTLLELTLDAHPALQSMDEQAYLQNALEDILGAGAKYPERLAGLAPEQLAAIRAKYWQRVGTRVTLRPGSRLVDKNPFNLLRLAVIRRLFPNARVLVTVRHPCDVILSCFMQHFRAADFALLCRTLPSLATGFCRTFDFWFRELAVLQPAARDVRYETLVVNFESEMRSIAKFLELPWDERLLDPGARARAKGYISTPSYAQVVEPVSARSVSRWQGYQQHFEALLPELEPLLQRWSYGRGVSPNSR
jgi:tetratricopeptide (TPR) repeat protein